MCPEKIFDTEEPPINEKFEDAASFAKLFTAPVARYLYDDFRYRSCLTGSSATLRMNYDDLGKAEKKFWLDYASAIPGKLRLLNLLLHRFSDFCRTCIITEEEISALTAIDLDRFMGKSRSAERKILFRELNYLIPAGLKKAGYEIFRPEEVIGTNQAVVTRIARAIHARYMHEIKRQTVNKPGQSAVITAEFDDLPSEIRQSNIDNATHIPTKLLSIGYRIRPAGKGFKPVALHLDESEIETMARVEHLRWSWEKRLNGWTSGKTKDEKNKTHPSLVPYDKLGEDEKEKDRELVKLIPAILQDINYEAYPISPGRISNLSYAIKPQSVIHKLLAGTDELSREIVAMAESSPEIREKLRSIDEKIRLTLSEAEGSYNYARHIQKTFLPEDLYIRECFPESFILYEPKDIVSGDFYLFSKQDGHVIFGLADCTGHGIPAALISTISYGILDQAVNIMRITDPANALQYLFYGIHRFLRRDLEGSGVSDDMNIVLCNLDIVSGILTWSGDGNILLHVRDKSISDNLCGFVHHDDDPGRELNFRNYSLELKTGDTLYMCTDGFADQFGGSNHRRYTRKRLSDFLLHISASPMPEQEDMLYTEFERWREEKNEGQTDDITVIGLRI
jgi:serine phosphatase RsbU (regulator of sigma subunit)